MAHTWQTSRLETVDNVLDLFSRFEDNAWQFRGQNKHYNKLCSSIDRDPYDILSRKEKLTLERRSIDCFHENAKFFASKEEEQAVKSDLSALTVLRHYGIPTRLIDWSISPYISLFFAVADNDSMDGELWTFNRKLYEEEGAKQWKSFPETTKDGSGDRYKFDMNMPTAFKVDEPRDWFVCLFYDKGFPRQDAQKASFSFTSRFNRDHAESIEMLLKDRNQFHLYIIPSKLKPALREMLNSKHEICRGSLFPDTAGAAETVNKIVFNQKLKQFWLRGYPNIV